MPLLSRGGLVA